MSLSMYQASIPVFIRGLTNLQHILSKAETFAQARKMEDSVLLQLRLAPDMFPLVRQVQIVSDAAKGCAARLAGVDVPSFPDTEKTFAELHERIRKTVDFLKTITPEQFEDGETRDIHIKTSLREFHFKGREYLLDFVIPNFYFHSSITYALLRHAGIKLGKIDFLGNDI